MAAFIYRYKMRGASVSAQKAAPGWAAFCFLAIFEYANREDAVQESDVHAPDDGEAGGGIGGICRSVSAQSNNAERNLVCVEG